MRTNLHNLIKKVTIYGFFFLFPLTSAYIPEFDLGFAKVNPELLWMFIMSCLFFAFLLQNPKRIKLSGISKAIIVYSLLFVGNVYANGQTIINTTLTFIAMSCFIVLLFENLDFNIEDQKKFLKVLTLLTIIIFVGSVLQEYVDQKIFWTSTAYNDLSSIDFSGYFRNPSIFASMLGNQGFIAFIFILVIFLFLNLQKINWRYGMMVSLILIVGFLTYTRYVMLTMLLSILIFILAKIRKGAFLPNIFIIAFSFLLFVYFMSDFMESNIFQTRVIADISSRTTAPMEFLQHYSSGHPIVFGTGFSSYDVEYFYGSIQRLHSGVWDLFFQGGIAGVLTFLVLLYQLHKRAMLIYKSTGNVTFLLFAPILLGINLTARLNLFIFWGYFLMFFYMCMEDKIFKNRYQMS